MGNSPLRKFLDPAPQWPAYVQAPWRSSRARDLDTQGGLDREVVPRGHSAEFLQPGAAAPAKAAATVTVLPSVAGPRQPQPPLQPLQPSGPVASAPRPRRLSEAQANTRPTPNGAASKASGLGGHSVAEWRLRTHAARRKATLVVRTMLRFRGGLQHPKRMRRLDSFSFFLPLGLAGAKQTREPVGQFAEEQQRLLFVRQQLLEDRAKMSMLEHADDPEVYSSSGRASPLVGVNSLPQYPAASGNGVPAGTSISEPATRSSTSMLPAIHDRHGQQKKKNNWSVNFSHVPRQHARRTAPPKDVVTLLTDDDVNSDSTGGSPSRPGSLAYASLAASIHIRSASSNAAAPAVSKPYWPTPAVSKQPRVSDPGGPIGGGAKSPQDLPVGPQRDAAKRNRLLPEPPGWQRLSAPASLPSIHRRRASGSLLPSKVASVLGKMADAASDPETEPPFDVSCMSAIERRAALQQINKQIENHTAHLGRHLQKLRQQLDASNSAWADGQLWGVPQVTPIRDYEAFLASDTFRMYKADAARKLRQGNIAFQIFAGDDQIEAEGLFTDLWTADPWGLIKGCMPSLPIPEAARSGLSLGFRSLASLALSVTAIAGSEALAKQVVLLHIADEQLEEVAHQLWDARFFGLSRENVLLFVQRRQRGYTWDTATASFTRSMSVTEQSVGPAGGATGPSDDSQLPGSGHSMLQLCWPGEALVVDSDGLPRQLLGTAMEALEARRVEWLLVYRSCDMSLVSRRGMLDESRLAWTLQLHETTRANLFLEVMVAPAGGSQPKLCDSLVLWHRSRPSVPDALPESRPQGSEMQTVVELRHCELQSRHMTDQLKVVSIKAQGKCVVGTGRYSLHLPSFRGVLTTNAVFRPRLVVDCRGGVHVRLDFTDLLRSEKVTALAVEAQTSVMWVRSPEDLVDYIGPLVEQDCNKEFSLMMDTLARMRQLQAHGAASLGRALTLSKSRKRRAVTPDTCNIVVFVADNAVSRLAVALAYAVARPGQDCVHLLTAMPHEAQRPLGQQLLQSLSTAATEADTAVNVVTEVMVRDDSSLMECFEQYCSAVGANIIVMGSAQMTTNVATPWLGSVAMTCVKRLGLPAMVVTANCSKTVERIATRRNLQCMALAETHSSLMAQFLSSRVLMARRGDSLQFAYVVPHGASRQVAAGARSPADSCANIAYGTQPQLQGPATGAAIPVPQDQLVRLLHGRAVEAGACMMALQVPPQRRRKASLPVPLLMLLRSTTMPVLVFPQY